jgi:hypothetical protein
MPGPWQMPGRGRLNDSSSRAPHQNTETHQSSAPHRGAQTLPKIGNMIRRTARLSCSTTLCCSLWTTLWIANRSHSGQSLYPRGRPKGQNIRWIYRRWKPWAVSWGIIGIKMQAVACHDKEYVVNQPGAWDRTPLRESLDSGGPTNQKPGYVQTGDANCAVEIKVGQMKPKDPTKGDGSPWFCREVGRSLQPACSLTFTAMAQDHDS